MVNEDNFQKTVKEDIEWERTFDAVPDLIAIVDKDYRIRRINHSMAKCLNIAPQDATGRFCFELVHNLHEPIEKCPLKLLLSDGKTHKREIYEPRVDKYFEVTVSPIQDADGNITGAVHIAHDITELKRMQEALKNLSLIDELTKLYNRRGFYTFSEQQIKIALRFRKKMLLIFLDINGMKYINDTFGHKAGDNALIGTADIIKRTFRDSDVIARFGGDEFVVLAIDSDENNIKLIRERLRKNLETYNNENRDKGFELSLSLGFSVYDPDINPSLEEMIDVADKDMYLDKKNYYKTKD